MRHTKDLKLEDYLEWDPSLKGAHLPSHHKWNLFRLSKMLVQPIYTNAGDKKPVIARGYVPKNGTQHAFGEAVVLKFKDKEEAEKAYTLCKVALHIAIGQCILKDDELFISLLDHNHHNEFRDDSRA